MPKSQLNFYKNKKHGDKKPSVPTSVNLFPSITGRNESQNRNAIPQYDDEEEVEADTAVGQKLPAPN